MRTTRITIVLTILVLTLFYFSSTSLLLSMGAQYPARSAYPVAEDYHDTSFWNITNAQSTPVTINTISTQVEQYESISLDEWYFTYESESLQEGVITINSVILKRTNISGPTPTLLFLHGYGGDYSGYIDVMRELAAIGGFIVMGIDHPGQGESTGAPELSSLTFLNVTTAPQDANLFHSVMAAVRAVTLLESLPYVDDSALVVSGNSMGAWTTLITSAIDSRVDGSIGMNVAGNLMNSILSGSLVNSVIDPSYSNGTIELQNVVRWFDSIAYARMLANPTLMFWGSNDDYYPIFSIKDTIEEFNAPLTLSIIPNYGHGFQMSWIDVMIKWMNEQFTTGEELPSIQVSSVEHLTLPGAAVTVTANVTNSTRAWVCWRSCEPGAVWRRAEMNVVREGTTRTYSSVIIPQNVGQITFYVIVEQEDSIQTSSGVFTRYAGTILYPLMFIVSLTILVILYRSDQWKPSREYIFKEYPYLIGVVMLVLGFILPFATIQGRASISVLDIVELFGNSFLLKGWFIPSFILSVCFIVSLSAYRHSFQFRIAEFLWIPILVVLIILDILLEAIFGFYGTGILVERGVGGSLYLLGIMIMLILDNVMRIKREETGLQLQETVSKP